mgnify:FL=1
MVSRKTETRGVWFRQVLHDLMRDRQVSAERLAKLCDVDTTVVVDTLRGIHIPSIDVAERMVNALGCDFEVMPRS